MNFDFFSFLRILLDVLRLTIFLRVLMSWVMPGQVNPVTNLLFHITEPMLAPLRRIIPRVGVFDLSPIAALIILWVIGIFIARL